MVAQFFSISEIFGIREGTDVVAVADCGHGLREELENRFPNMQFILNKPHLREHLYETAEALGFNQARQHQWVHSNRDQISHGHAQKVFASCVALNATELNDRLRQFVGYVSRVDDLVHYDRCRKPGYPICSGEMESARRAIPQDRLKLPDACWHSESINRLLAFNVTRANDCWDDFGRTGFQQRIRLLNFANIRELHTCSTR